MNANKFKFQKLKGAARLATLFRASAALLLMLARPISAQSGDAGVKSSNAAGNSNIVTSNSSYVTIPPDSPPETFYTITYNQGTDSEGEARWHDEVDGNGEPVDDFKRTYQLNFEDVQRSFPMAFTLGIKGPNPPLPAPTFTVTGAVEKDTVDGKTSKPYTAFYMTDSITDSTQVLVKDDLKTALVGSSPNAEFHKRWSLGPVSRAEPVAMTSSELIEIDDMKYALVVPLSAGGDYLSNIDPETGKPVYNKSLKALYLHKPDRMKVILFWEPASAVRVWHTPFKARTDGNHYFDGEIQNGQAFYQKDDENPIFVEIVEAQNAKLRWGIDALYHEIDLIPMDLDIHQPQALSFSHEIDPSEGLIWSAVLPPEIPESEQQEPDRCQILINNDNDDLDTIFSGSGILNPYPADNVDTVLKIKTKGGNAGANQTNDDDAVMVTMRQFDGIETGKIRLTTSDNADVRFFKYEEGQANLDAVNFNDLVVDLSNPGTTSPLKDLPNEDVSFLIEGRNTNEDLTVSMVFEDANENELARQEVHLRIRDVVKTIGLVAIAHHTLAEGAVQDYLTKHIQGANMIRNDRDGLDGNADTLVPVLFKLDLLMSPDTANDGWDILEYSESSSSSNPDEVDNALTFINNIGAQIYVSSSIRNTANTFFPYGITHRDSKSGMCVSLNRPRPRVIAHEWLHAYGDEGHTCVDYHLMTGSNDGEPPCSADSGFDTQQILSDKFIDYAW